MSPKFMWVQTLCLVLACALLGLLPAHAEAGVLALLLAAHWLAMNMAYAAALAGRRRSVRRKRQDRQVRRQALLAVACGLAAAVASRWVDDVWPWRDRELLTVSFGALGALAWVVYASSLVDWYYVRPRIDGIVREPPCRSSGDDAWGDVMRVWYMHRGIAEFTGLVAVIVAFSAFVGALIAGDGTLPTAAAVALPTGAPGALVLLTQTTISTLRHRVLNRPWLWVGDALRDDGWRAYVLALSVRGLLVRERDDEAGGWGRERELTHERLDSERIRHGRFDDCAHRCSGVNPACEWAATERDAGPPRRWLIW